MDMSVETSVKKRLELIKIKAVEIHVVHLKVSIPMHLQTVHVCVRTYTLCTCTTVCICMPVHVCACFMHVTCPVPRSPQPRGRMVTWRCGGQHCICKEEVAW